MSAVPYWMSEDDPRIDALRRGEIAVAHVESRRLGQRPSEDERDQPYAAAARMELLGPAEATRTYRYYYERFNQNQVGPTCVANTGYHLLGDSPAPRRSMLGMDGTGEAATLVDPSTGKSWEAQGYVSQTSMQKGWRGLAYDLAQLNDEWSDTPPEGGTSGRALGRVLKASGLISNYLWLHTAEEVAQAILGEKGPVAIGSMIYAGMYYVENGAVWMDSGAGIGGHEYVLSGFNRSLGTKGQFRVQTWGIHFKLPYEVLDRLFSDGADAMLVVKTP